MKGKLAELSDDGMRFVVGGSHEIAETLFDGLMSDKTHPGFVM